MFLLWQSLGYRAFLLTDDGFNKMSHLMTPYGPYGAPEIKNHIK